VRDVLPWIFLIGVTTVAYAIPLLGRRWRWCWFAAIAAAFALAVIVIAMLLELMDRGEGGFGLLGVMLLLWPLVCGLVVAAALQIEDRRGGAMPIKRAIAAAGWVTASLILVPIR
jgi:hypothetical protein